MTFANGTIGEIIKALDISGVEMITISLPESRIVDATQCLMRRWSCNRYQLVGKQLSQSRNSELFACYVDDGLTGVSTKEAMRIEVTYSPVGGQPVTTRFKPQHIKDQGSDYLLLIKQIAPDLKATDETETQARLELAVKAGGYGSWAYDFHSETSKVSTELYDILGYANGDKRLEFGNFEQLVHPDDRDQTVGAAMSRNAPGKYWHSRMRILNGSDDYVWIEQITALVRDPLTGGNAKAIGLIRDVTDEMQTIKAIETSQRNLARSQAVARIGSWAIDVATGDVSWSDQMHAILGLEPDDEPVSMEMLLSLLPEPHRARWLENMEMVRASTRSASFAVLAEISPDDQRHIEVHIDCECDSNGTVTELHGICRDITEQNLLERKFLQAQKMESVGRLTGGIAHDFNNLLMVMIGNLQLVEQMAKNEPKILKRLSTAIDAANKGSELTKRMLAFSRQQSTEDEVIDVDDLVGGMHEMLERAIGSHIALTVEASHGVWPVRADRTQLETAILNLGINARDAMPDGGKLAVRTENVQLDEAFCAGRNQLMPGDFVKISVTDTGHGMPPEIIEKVTEPFFTTKDVDKGSGLGLSMISGFVQQSNGVLDIVSKVDAGTTMAIYLPRAEVDASEDAAAETGAREQSTGAEPVEDETPASPKPVLPAEPPAGAETVEIEQQTDELPAETVEQANEPQAQNRRLILVVEDNDAVRDVAVAMIEDMGWDVLEAADGASGLKIIEENPDIDLLLSDVVMPGMNGPELAALAQKIRPSLPVLFASGYTQGTTDEIKELPNFIELINKPFTRDDLTSKIAKALELQEAA